MGRVGLGTMIGGVDDEDDEEESEAEMVGFDVERCLWFDNDLSITCKSKSNVMK